MSLMVNCSSEIEGSGKESLAGACPCRIRQRLILGILPVLLLLGISYESFGRFEGWGDESGYLRAAEELYQGDALNVLFPGARFAIPAIIYLFKLTGLSFYWAGAIAAFVFSAGTVWLIAARWGRRFPWCVPFMAACVLATCPMFAHYSSAIYPEPFAAFFVIFTHLAHRSSVDPGLRSGLIVGILVGISVVVKQTCIIIWPIFLLHVAWIAFKQRRTRPAILYACASALGGSLVFILTIVFFAYWKHDAFYFLKQSAMLGSVFQAERLEAAATSEHISNVRYLLAFGTRDFAFLGVFLLIASLVSIVQGKCKLEAALGLGIVSYLALGSVSLTQYIPPMPVERYLFLAIPFMAMCLAYQLYRAVVFCREDRMWPSSTRQCLKYACALFVLAWFASNVLFTLLDAQPLFPVNRQLEMFRLACADKTERVFITQRTRDIFFPLLDAELKKRLELLDVMKPNARVVSPWGDMERQIRTDLPTRFKLVLHYHDYERLKEIQRVAPWGDSDVKRPPFRLSALRRFIDKIRGKKKETYPVKAPMIVVEVNRS
jgi:hypothetical protein